ncbi:MAG: hypothetical protein N0A16_00795 [Blastocatellia bacterium]|nr:hypothetical protein [Blastocatellia bacterium]MCS7156250.1 hypothetical protein [Blastocatellia bacterium]MCX7751400.1 hypothetical protein [Blastocatellia bacterium]MDW8169113.1 hypothetical protein [Acidobacteriota bacterium]MDW8255817.1 hypothetical protein [Acidobacteriota bacterium]
MLEVMAHRALSDVEEFNGTVALFNRQLSRPRANSRGIKGACLGTRLAEKAWRK